MGRPPKEWPADPLAELIPAHGRASFLAEVNPFRNSQNVTDPKVQRLAASLRRLEHLAEEARQVNEQKAAVFRDLREAGYVIGAIKTILAERRIDAAVLEERAEKVSGYRALLMEALDAIDDGDVERVA